MTEIIDKKIVWEELPVEQKENEIFEVLTAIDLDRADPSFSRAYIEAKNEITDSSDRMRLDLQMFNIVVKLRKEGKMLPAEELHLRAKAIASFGADEMRKAFDDFSRELKQPK